MAAVDAAKLVTPGVDPIMAMLSELMKPARKETITGAGGGATTTTATSTASTANVTALQQLVAQLQAQATPAGSAQLIQEIFKTGMQQNMPSVNAATSGARAGSSTYRALAVNDLTARLAGQAAAELNRTTQTATTAATALAEATKGTTQTQTQTQAVAPKTETRVSENKFNLQDLILPIGVSAGKTVLKNILGDVGKKAAGAAAAAFAPEAIGASTAFANEFATVPAAFDFASLPGVAATSQGGSITDFITSGGTVTPYAAPVATTATESSNFFDFSGDTSSAGGGGGPASFATNVVMNEIFGGGNNADTLGQSAVYATPYIGPIAAAADILGVSEIQKPVQEVVGVTSDIIQGAGDVVSGAGDVVSSVVDTITGGTVICTELNRRGILKPALYHAYAEQLAGISPITMRGYQLWAVPVVRVMRKERWYSKVLVKLATPFAIGRVLRIIGLPSFAGAVTVYIGEPVCYVLGLFCCSNKPLVTEV